MRRNTQKGPLKKYKRQDKVYRKPKLLSHGKISTIVGRPAGPMFGG